MGTIDKRYVGLVDDNFPGDLAKVNNDDMAMLRRGNVIETIMKHLQVEQNVVDGTSFSKLMVADLYRPISLLDMYLKEISNTPINNAPAGTTPATDDAFTAARAKDALIYFRALLGIIACGKDRLGYDDTNLADLPKELGPFRELVPILDPIIDGKTFASNSTIRSIYWLNRSEKIYFALASPYTLFAPVFHGMDRLCKLNAFPWMKDDDVRDPAKSLLPDAFRKDIVNFASALLARISASRTRQASLFKAILNGYISAIDSGLVDPNRVAYHDASCDMVLQEHSGSLPIISGKPYIPQGDRESILRQLTFNGVEKLFDIKHNSGDKPTIGDHVSDGLTVDDNGRICLILNNLRNCTTTADNYHYNPDGTTVEVTADVTIIDNNTNDSVTETVTRSGSFDDYFVSPALVIVSKKANKSAALLDNSNFITVKNGENIEEYLVVKPVAQALFDKTVIRDFSVSDEKASFYVDLALNLTDGKVISKHYTDIPCGTADEMLDMAVWPCMAIDGYEKYYFFSTTKSTFDGGASAGEHDLLKPAQIKYDQAQNHIDSEMLTQRITAFPKKIDLFRKTAKNEYQYSGCVKTDVRDARGQDRNKEVRYAVDFGTSNTAIYSMDRSNQTNAFNYRNNIGSIAYTNHNADLINTFFIPWQDDGKPSIKPVFGTLLFRKDTKTMDLEMLSDYLVFFNAGYLRDQDLKEKKEALCNKSSDPWMLLSNLKSTQIEHAKLFLTQLIQMIIVEARLNGYDSISGIEFTYPLSFSESEKNSIKGAVTAAIRGIDRAGLNVDDFNYVGITKEIDESKAGIVFCTESAGKLPEISDLVDTRQTIAMIDIGGGTTDISIAPSQYLGGAAGMRIDDIFTSSVKLGARKMAIHHLQKMFGRGELIEYFLERLGLKDDKQFAGDVEVLRSSASNESVFTEHYEFMLGCKVSDGSVFGSKFAMFAEKDDNKTFIRYRSILSFQLLYIAYCIGLLLHQYEADRDLKTMNLKVVLAGNGSRIFDVISDNLKQDLVYRGVYLGMKGDVYSGHMTANHNILYQNTGYEAFIKTEVARGALDALRTDTRAQFVVPAGASFECNVGDEKHEHNDQYEDIHISDYFFGSSSIPSDKDDQPMLWKLIEAYNTSSSLFPSFIYGIKLEDAVATAADTEISVLRDNVKQGAEKNFNLLPKAEQRYDEDTRQLVARLEKNGGIVTTNQLVGDDLSRYTACLRVSPMTFVIESICDQISFNR